ncbi:DUF3795 domain-containing protein [Eubacteriales bacterium OttesenSCG-928-N13]|nr:DUF3795 domain-containing protein [Eubacteriales bacterium OttesenSCG-928-N13]
MNVRRVNPELSACGLNCGLCPRYHTDGASRCPGCGGEGFFDKRPSCGIISCNQRHGGVEFCFLCDEYPCKKYDGVDQVDSFITHRNMLHDFERAAKDGLPNYLAELKEKMGHLDRLLDAYNDGRSKSLFCTAVNLLPIEDVHQIMQALEQQAMTQQTPKERAQLAAQLLRQAADARDIDLTLRKNKPSK